MKTLLIIMLFPIFSFTQTIPDTCFTEQEIIQISKTLDSLWQLDEINNNIISQQENIVNKQNMYIRLDSIQIQLQQQQVILLQKNINLYKERELRLQPKWYDNKNIWFWSGILTAIGSGILINSITK